MKNDWKNTHSRVYQHSYRPSADKLFANTNAILLDFVSAHVDEIVEIQIFEIEFAVYETTLSAQRDWD